MVATLDEVRREPEVRIAEFCPTEFEHEGGAYHAFMADLTSKGAKFREMKNGRKVCVRTGDCLLLNIKTPYGMSQASGEVRWVREDDGMSEWGMSFTGISEDAIDPLRCLMDSPM